MNFVEKVGRTKVFNMFASLLLIFSLLTSAIPPKITFADDGSQRDGHGSIKNGEGEIDYDEATINKEVSFGNKSGEYFIDLTVKGKDLNAGMTTDIVIPYDLSNSMENNNVPGTNRTRTAVAAEATKDFVNGLLGSGNNYRIAFVPYGTSIMDGNTTSYLGNPGGYTFQQLNSYNYYVGNFTSNANDITSKIPSSINHGNHGGTFTQQALERAGQIMSTSNADRKIIVTITDGLPTLSYNQNRQSQGTGTENQQNMQEHRTNTIAEANTLKNNYTLYSIGVGLSSTSTAERQVIEGIADGADNAYYANSVPDLVNALNDISSQLKSNTVVNGSITDPITDEFILQDGYEITGSDGLNTDNVIVTTQGKEVLVEGLDLGEDEWVNIRYTVQIDTENPDLDPKKLYKTNGTTILTPNGEDPNTKREFPEPEASAEPLIVSGKKAWVDWGYDVHRPDEITLQLVREINGEERVIEEITVTNNGEDVWGYEFEEAVVYDNNGERINYVIREIMPDEIKDYYISESGSITGETTDVRNMFQPNAKIQLVKIAKSTSELGEDELEVGKDINYTFEFTNTGNLPLKYISLEDELDGISVITYETLNDEPLTQDISEVVMQPGDVIVATATYEVTQEDFDHGQVVNHAEVVGTPTVPNPGQFGGQMNPFDDTPVKDDDDAAVPGKLNPAISLTKTADKENITKADETVEYTFDVKNTGNTILTEVTLNDPMLGGEITLDVNTLNPGETTTVTVPYKVTQEDINNGEIINKADVEGTPPPAYAENPDNPDKVTDEDDEIVKADQTSEIELVKESDKEELVKDETIKYTFTATNTGNTTLTNVKITDVLEGISDIEYLTVNSDAIADPDNITLEPGNVLVATATYEVTQDDVDLGQVFNEATVIGIDPKDEEVTDKDDTAVPSNPELGIELVKTSDKQYVTEAGDEIEYTFEVTNTSSVTLKDVEVSDPMLNDLGIDIELDKTTLKPGEKTTGTATYEVTKEDIEAGKIENIATTTGTPPNPHDEPPTSPPAENEVPVAKIQLEKSVLPGIYTEVGQELTYTLVVTNTGEVMLNDVTLNDDMLGGELILDVDSLNPGESTEVEVPYTVTEEDVEAGEVLNTAKTEGTPEGYDSEDPNTPGKVTDEDDATAKYTGLIIEKTSDKEEIEKAGDKITYTFEVTNNGKTTLENIVVNDEMLEELEIEVELEKTTLKPGESTTGTAIYTVTQKDIDNGGVYNVATTTGTPPGYDPEDPEYPDEPPVSPPDEENVPSDRNPSIELVKSAETEEYTEVGQEIEYVFTVTNTGNTTLNDVKVEDETFKLEVSLGETTLAPGDSTTGRYTHTVTQADLNNGNILNEANTEGTPPPVIDPEDPDNPVEQDPVTDEDDEKIPGKQEAELSLTKKADKQEVSQAGEEITYTLTVTNTGNVTLEDVTVKDEMLGGNLLVEPSTLAPGETGTVTGTYIVTQEDIDRVDEIVNIATATGTPPGGDPEDPDNPETPPVEEDVSVNNDPNITLVKQADKEKLVEGETITYTFTATNTGNTTLNKVNLVDELEGLSDIDYLTVNENAIEDADNISLKPGDVLVATATYVVTQANVDANEVYNEAVVEGTPPAKDNPEDPENPIEQEPVTDDDDEKVPAEHKADLSLEKIADQEEVTKAGEVITYKFIVTNTGNVTLDNISVDDPMLEEASVELEYEKTSLVPGEATTATGKYTVTQDDIDNHEKILNIATATGTPPVDPENPPVTPPVEEEVPVEKNPEIHLLKHAEQKDYAKVGDEITYTFAVTNTGNVTLTDVKVYDETFDVGVDVEQNTLKPGESTTGTYTHTVTQEDLDNGEIHNFANTEGTPPPVIDPEDPDKPVEQDPVTDEDDEKVTAEIDKGLELTKEADKQEVSQAGDEITYTLTVTNTGNVTLKDVTVNDEMLGGDLLVEPSTLAPGETGTVSGTYVVTQEDIDSVDKLINIATATGTPPVDPENPPVTPPVEEEVPVVDNPDITLVKQADKERLIEGETIKYTFTATNTGNTTLNQVSLVDELEGLSDINYLTVNDKAIDDTDNITLKPGDVLVATATYVVTQDDVDANEVYNEAVVEGTPPAKENPEDPENPIERDPVTDKDDAKVPSEHKPEIALEKVTQKEEVSQAGEVITYKFVVTNTGNVTLDNVKVDDPMLEELGIEIELDKQLLAPGESTVGYADYTVTQEDIDNVDEIVNIATATGTPPGGDPEDPDNPKTPPVEEEVPVIKTPEIAIEKTAEEDKVVEAGETITYNFVVKNTGNLTLKDVKVEDEMLEKAGIDVELETTTLKPGEATTGSATYTVTQADIDAGFVYNKATSTGTPPGYDPEDPPTDPEDPNFPPVSPPDEVEVPAEQDPAINIVKEANKKEVSEAGEKITYTFTVTNTGNVTLEDVKVYDETFKTDVDVEETELAPGESTTGTLEYVVTQDNIDNNGIHNVATAEGTPPNYDPEDPDSEKPTDEDDEKVFNKKEPNISLEKTSDVEKVTSVGQKVTYTFVATNTGNTTLTDVVLTDPMLEEAGIEVALDKTTLAPGEKATGTAVYTTTEADLEKSELVNIATVEGTPPGYDPADPESPQKPTDEDKNVIDVEKPTKPTPVDPPKPGDPKPTPQPEQPEPGKQLPKTATELFNLMAVGLSLLLTGTIYMIANRRRNKA